MRSQKNTKNITIPTEIIIILCILWRLSKQRSAIMHIMTSAVPTIAPPREPVIIIHP